MPTWCSEEVSWAGAQGWKGEGQGCQGGRHAGGPGAGARSRDSTLGQRGAVGEHGAELGPGHSLAQVRKTGWGRAMCQEAAVKSGEETTRGWMKIEETGWWERMPPSRWVPAHVGPWERSQSQSRAGPGWGEQRVAAQLDGQSQHGECNNQSIPGQCGCRDVRVWLLYHPFLHSRKWRSSEANQKCL